MIYTPQLPAMKKLPLFPLRLAILPAVAGLIFLPMAAQPVMPPPPPPPPPPVAPATVTARGAVVARGTAGARRGGPLATVAPLPNPTPGSLVMRDSKGQVIGVCPLQHTDVQANIAGFVARVRVKQEFRNLAKEPVEAIYTFPLPDDASVDDMAMRIGDRLIVADIKKREEATQIYQAARAAGQNAALLNQERANVFTQSVANLMPGQAITIEISFVQVIKYDQGHYEWSFPTVVGPRYTGGDSAGPDPEKVTPAVMPEGLRAGHDIAITVNLDAGVPLREVVSTLHQIDLTQPTKTTAVIKLHDKDTIPNKDFILRYAVAGDQIQSGVIALAPTGGDSGYFTLILQPPAAPPPADIAPKEMIFVIDQTGSQNGLPIQKAKETMTYCLQHLNPKDTFQLIGFNTVVNPCEPAPVAATPENVNQALAWLAGIQANGGTDIYKAVDYVLNQPGDTSRPRIVCLMTDGYIGNDKAIIELVAEHRGLSRFFPFGIGNSVNRYLIDGMAREGRGVADYVGLNDDGKTVAEKFYQRVAEPLLLDPGVEWGALPVAEVFPRHIPDIFSAAPIILTGRYEHGGSGVIKISGQLRGKPWSQEVAVTLPDTSTANAEGLRKVWARQKIDDLEIEDWKTNISARPLAPNSRYNATSELKAKVTEVALKYRIMSDYTSFVAVEQRVINVGGQQHTVDVPVELPDGVTSAAMGGPGTAPGSYAYSAPRAGGRGGAGLGGAGGGGGAGATAGGGRGGAGRGAGGAGGSGGGRGPLLGGAGAAGSGGRRGGAGAVASAIVVDGPAPVPTASAALNDSAGNSNLALGNAAALRQLAAMTVEDRVAALRTAKLAEALRTLPTVLAQEGKDGTLTKVGLPVVTKGRMEVQIWLNALPADGLAQLKALGFDLAATLTPDKLLLGTADVAKLDDLIALNFVRLIEPPSYH